MPFDSETHEPDADTTAASTDARSAEAEEIARLRAEFRSAIPIAGTPAECYLVEHRGLSGPWPDALRWSGSYQVKPDVPPRPCLLAAVTKSPGEIVALHSIELDPLTGAKSTRTPTPKLSSGPVGDGAVFLGTEFDSPQTLVIGEGVETTLTRCLVGPCDAYACVGGVKFVEQQPHHKRVEILADNGAREAARLLARKYADRKLTAYVVTSPDLLGDKADLNDVLRDLGRASVEMAVEDAERFVKEPSRYSASGFDLKIGSDVEIAQQITEKLEEVYGPIVETDGRFWRFDRTHWAPIDDNHLVRFIHRADGALYPTAKGVGTVRLGEGRISSIMKNAIRYKSQPGFFASPARGINCESGFIRIDAAGNATLEPHARKWRQRHAVRGRWSPDKGNEARFKESLLAKFLRDTVRSDGVDGEADKEKSQDAEEKLKLLGEVAGCAALGCGTRLRNPKAIVAFSDAGGTGKSCFLHLLRALPNPEAVSSVPPAKFADERFAVRLIGKVLNAADELSEHALRSDVFKRVITGEPIPARDVYRSAIDFSPIALNAFSTNRLPKFSGGVDGGVVRRLLPIDFAHVVPEKERNEELPELIVRDEADLLLDFAVNGACRLMQQRDFTVPPSSRELLQRWLIEADPVHGWAHERVEVIEGEHLVSISTLYRDFVDWCLGQGMRRDFLPTAVSFGKRLRSVLPKLQFHRSDGSFCRNARLKSATGQ